MIQKDYIMRMIQQLASATSKILKQKEAHQYPEALETINRTFQELFGMNSALFDRLSTDSIIELLKIKNSEVMQRCFWIADLIKEEAEIYESQKDIQMSKHKYLKSLELYLKGITYGDASSVSDYFARIKEIINKFEQHELPNKTKCNLLRYYKEVGDYSKVEDLLFELLELEEEPEKK